MRVSKVLSTPDIEDLYPRFSDKEIVSYAKLPLDKALTLVWETGFLEGRLHECEFQTLKNSKIEIKGERDE